MNPEQIIIWLRGKAKEGTDHASVRMLNAAADTIEALQAELRDEMHRHDRLQDFKVAEAQQLAEIKAERDAMAAELKHDQGCADCVHCDTEWCEEPCDSCRQDPKFPAWKWRGRS